MSSSEQYASRRVERAIGPNIGAMQIVEEADGVLVLELVGEVDISNAGSHTRTAEATPAQLARRIFTAIEQRDLSALETRIHERAVIEIAMAQGRLLKGRRAVMRVLRDGLSRFHAHSITRLYELSPTAVIIDGRTMHRTEDGWIADYPIVWLCEYEDGKLIRQRLFRTIAEARQAWNLHD